jgi:hypothetical protein
MAFEKIAIHDEAGAVPFTPIGMGTPLRLAIEHVYTGIEPKHKSDLLLTSATKSPLVVDAATTAVNSVHSQVGPRSTVEFDANQTGTPLVYYATAVAWESLTVTLQITAKDGLEKYFTSLGDLFDKAAGLPIFTAASAYLLGAKGLLRVADDLLFRNESQPIFSETFELRVAEAGFAPAQAGFYLLSPDSAGLRGFEYEPGTGLIDAGGQEYQGDSPYMVLSCDGARRDDLAGFQARALDAALLAQFSPPGGATGQAVATDVLSQLSSLYNDWSYRQKALALMAEPPPLSPTDESKLQAYLANIQDAAFRPAVKGTGE